MQHWLLFLLTTLLLRHLSIHFTSIITECNLFFAVKIEKKQIVFCNFSKQQTVLPTSKLSNSVPLS